MNAALSSPLYNFTLAISYTHLIAQANQGAKTPNKLPIKYN